MANNKRYGKEFDNDSLLPPKKAKIEKDDLWGDDFDDNAIEEMDIIASQACSPQEARVDTNLSDARRRKRRRIESGVMAGPSLTRTLDEKVSKSRPSEKVSSSEKQLRSIEAGDDDDDEIATPRFEHFESNLLRRQHLNSTFCPKKDLVLSTDETLSRHLEKLEQENKKLLDDFMTKEGETVFLRSQLQQTQLRSENEKIEKARFIEEQASRHRAELDALHKEKENLKTQNEFQALQLGTLMERCKLLEAGTVKLTQPQRALAGATAASPDSSRCRKLGVNRTPSTPRAVRLNERSVQTEDDRASECILRTTTAGLHDYPLRRIPRAIFEPSVAEKSVVDIEIIEKIGRKNLPILQEEETFRIFENPVLVKPIVSVVDGRRLNVEFFLPDLAVMMKKTRAEINSEDCVPIVNRIVSATRELFLNSTIVLHTIFAAMKNDDIRDMNDLYFSDFYNKTIDDAAAAAVAATSICDCNMWYEKERGIEARRAMGVLSYVAEASNYLCEYITGKTRLMVEKDDSYAKYNQQMIRYSRWAKKGHNFEILEMMLEFVGALGLVRRSHQFSGLICAIATTLSNVQKRVNFCPRGLEYVTSIFREMIFSRPLFRCFLSMTKMMEIFCKLPTFGSSLCFCRADVKIWNGVLHFTSDACPLEIYMAQIERFRLDSRATIEMSEAFLSAVNRILPSERIAWITDSSRSCNCCSRLLSYAVTLLCECSRIDSTKTNDPPLSSKMKKIQVNALKKGIQFLSYLAKREPDFIIRVSDIEDSFHLLMQRLATFEGLAFHENEQEALALVKLSLSPERAAAAAAAAAAATATATATAAATARQTITTTTERPHSQRSTQIFGIKSAFEKKFLPSVSSGRWFEVEGIRESRSERATAVYREFVNGTQNSRE